VSDRQEQDRNVGQPVPLLPREALFRNRRRRYGTALVAFQNLSNNFNAALDIAPPGFCRGSNERVQDVEPPACRPADRRRRDPESCPITAGVLYSVAIYADFPAGSTRGFRPSRQARIADEDMRTT